MRYKLLMKVEENKVESIKRDKVATEKFLQETIEKHQIEITTQKEHYTNALNAAKEAEALAEARANDEARTELESLLKEAGERESTLVKTLEELRHTLSRKEQQAASKEDMLHRDIDDLQTRYKASERRCEELITQVPESTRPLLRQIEAMQETTARRAEAWVGVERSLNSRLQEAEAKAAVAEENERSMNERVSQTLSRMAVLEAQVSCLRAELTQLSRSLEKERQRASENRQEYLAAQEAVASHEIRVNQLEVEIRELKKRHKQELQDIMAQKELLQQCPVNLQDLKLERTARLELERNTRHDASILAEQGAATKQMNTYSDNGAIPQRKLSSAGSLSSIEESFFLQASLDSSDSFSERRHSEVTMTPYFLKSMTPSTFEATLRQKDGELASYMSRLISSQKLDLRVDWFGLWTATWLEYFNWFGRLIGEEDWVGEADESWLERETNLRLRCYDESDGEDLEGNESDEENESEDEIEEDEEIVGALIGDLTPTFVTIQGTMKEIQELGENQQINRDLRGRFVEKAQTEILEPSSLQLALTDGVGRKDRWPRRDVSVFRSERSVEVNGGVPTASKYSTASGQIGRNYRGICLQLGPLMKLKQVLGEKGPHNWSVVLGATYPAPIDGDLEAQFMAVKIGSTTDTVYPATSTIVLADLNDGELEAGPTAFEGGTMQVLEDLGAPKRLLAETYLDASCWGHTKGPWDGFVDLTKANSAHPRPILKSRFSSDPKLQSLFTKNSRVLDLGLHNITSNNNEERRQTTGSRNNGNIQIHAEKEREIKREIIGSDSEYMRCCDDAILTSLFVGCASEVRTWEASLESIRDSLAEELVKMTEQCEKLRSEAAILPGVRSELEALRRRHSAALELMGERDEELEELRADIVDLKEMYREQVNMLVNQIETSTSSFSTA
ncbi:hypothetical protein GIB67_013562 [Kingdonia uniflora]|uniref:TATA element modulatory factor 1 TATA binding domain-containing protein n=1 Tax=Kingdonia uniflora TaxID=39325 RepID=A0A7J7KUY5_9MAGN|nr:hypothetical protein GIB67_013562 [Kingdonia uniflora]